MDKLKMQLQLFLTSDLVTTILNRSLCRLSLSKDLVIAIEKNTGGLIVQQTR